MNKKSFLSVFSLLLLTPVIGYSQDTGLVPKQLAGPPAEFSSMQPASAMETATHSKSALIPIQLTQKLKGQWSWQTDLPIDGNDLQVLVFSNNSNDWDVSMRGPADLRAQSIDALTIAASQTDFGLSEESHPADYYKFAELPQGQWTFAIDAANPKQKEGFLMIGSDSPQRILSYQASGKQIAGQRIGFATYGYSEDESAARVNSASLRVTAPDNQSVVSYPMYDDGLHSDGRANDGVFGGDFLASEAGNYNVQVVVTGEGINNQSFIRTTEHLVPVIDSDLNLSTSAAYTTELNDNRLMINLGVETYNDAAKYHVYAEVWGQSNQNFKQMVPVSWIGGMATVDNGNLSLGLDARWVARADATAPFELRNVRIEDPDHFIRIAEAKTMPLSVPVLPDSATRAFNGNIDTEMLMGQQPIEATRGVGSKLLLVHGYCSGNVWGPVSGQFSNDAIFLDLDQNRSHDQFAVRIHNFGNAYNSYGIVAHSQGGAAATHLYTFYWSGLDNATGERLIQSVGTPYQGTALAGNLAALGSVFGVGCGSNTDLTYNGAANWLAGIPSWARSKVNYYSTSFTDVWWRYDYCHLATDLLLSDPEDGTTEKAYAQLSGAINRGHKTGWCHTSGMRDPAQTTDSSRNSTMNSTAAR